MVSKNREIIARNITLLMGYQNIKQAALARRTGISQKTISNVLNPGATHSPTMDTIEKLAGYFGMEAYHLMIPGMPIDQLLSPTIDEIIALYARAPQDGRDNIRRTAINEVRYNQPDRRQAAERRRVPRAADRRTASGRDQLN